MYSWFLLPLVCFAVAEEECGTTQWTRRSSSSVQVQFREHAPNDYRPVAVLFTPHRPVPDNLTEIMILPASAEQSCGEDECDPEGDFDLVFFTKSIGRRHFLKTELELVQCDEVETCKAKSIPESTRQISSLFPVEVRKTPTYDPSLKPSVGPSSNPSASPSLSPSTGPSVEPSAGPTTGVPTIAPTPYPHVKMKLMLDEKVLWKQQNINLLKNLFSTMYEVPYDTINLVTVTRNSGGDDGIDVQLEIRDHGQEPIEVSFEDQVYITGRLQHSSLLLQGDGDSLVSLEILKRTDQFGQLQEVICGSLSEAFHDVKVREVKQFGSQFHLTIEATLQPSDVAFQLNQLEDVSVHRRTMVLPIRKDELFTFQRLEKMKGALSERLPGINKRDIKIISCSPEAEGSTSVEMEIQTNNANVLDNLTHEDEVFIVDQILHTRPSTTSSIAGICAVIFLLFIGSCVLYSYSQQEKEGHYAVLTDQIQPQIQSQPGARMRLHKDPPQKEGEPSLSILSSSSEQIEGQVRPGCETHNSDVVLSPVIASLTDEEAETPDSMIMVSSHLEPTIILSHVQATLTDEED